MNKIELNMNENVLHCLSEDEVMEYVNAIIGNVNYVNKTVKYNNNGKIKTYKLDNWMDMIGLVWDIYHNDNEIDKIEKVQKLITLFGENAELVYFFWDEIMVNFLIPFNFKENHKDIYNSFNAVHNYNEFMKKIDLVDKKQDELLGFKLIDLSKWNNMFTQMAKEDSIINVLQKYTGEKFKIVIDALEEDDVELRHLQLI